jgi:hypothetical protein
MFGKPSSKVLIALFVVALICVLVVSGPVHVALHGDSPGDGCDVCHLAATSLPILVLVPALTTHVEAAMLLPEDVVVEPVRDTPSAPRAPPAA